MNADERRSELDEITQKVIGCVYAVSNTLGNGFLEKVYENALAIELRKADLNVEQQHRIQVNYEGTAVGEFFADLVVEKRVLLDG
jgi:GxxExxY protein